MGSKKKFPMLWNIINTKDREYTLLERWVYTLCITLRNRAQCAIVGVYGDGRRSVAHQSPCMKPLQHKAASLCGSKLCRSYGRVCVCMFNQPQYIWFIHHAGWFSPPCGLWPNTINGKIKRGRFSLTRLWPKRNKETHNKLYFMGFPFVFAGAGMLRVWSNELTWITRKCVSLRWMKKQFYKLNRKSTGFLGYIGGYVACFAFRCLALTKTRALQVRVLQSKRWDLMEFLLLLLNAILPPKQPLLTSLKRTPLLRNCN